MLHGMGSGPSMARVYLCLENASYLRCHRMVRVFTCVLASQVSTVDKKVPVPDFRPQGALHHPPPVAAQSTTGMETQGDSELSQLCSAADQLSVTPREHSVGHSVVAEGARRIV